MLLVACNRRIATAATAVLLLSCGTNAGTITTAPKATPTSSVPQTCEFRTINYITDSLPQQCLKSAWSNLNGTASVKPAEPANATVVGEVGSVEGTVTTSTDASISSTGPGEAQNTTGGENLSGESVAGSSSARSTVSETAEASAADLEGGELNEASFLSFEEWKKQTLEKAGQQNANIGGRRSGEHKKKDPESFQNNLESLGDEEEIDLDFGAFRSGKKGEEASEASQTGEPEVEQETRKREGEKDQYRSKDAGKTCKERFSYASIDAGATILKTHAGAKNSKAVLIENKDSYMLSECATDNKFLIIELSEDIWIDTLVLANYEFFSSMIRTFRVSVSDRYPVKMEKWKDLGTYEARNSREIQAFLIENPQIWARYMRIEFLSHYGNEYYCPLSLVRVHGSRLLESWKETEANGDDEDNDEAEDAATEDRFIPDAVADVVQEEERINAELKEAQVVIDELVKTAQNITTSLVDPALNSSHLGDASASLQGATTEQTTTPWIPDFDFGTWMNVTQGLDVCLPKEAPSPKPVITETASTEAVTSITGPSPEPIATLSPPVANSTVSPIASSASEIEVPIPPGNATIEVTPTVTSVASNITGSSSTSNSSILSSSTAPSVTRPQNTTNSLKNKTSSTSGSPSPLPTQQESFFKAVSRRLQLLETNSTLSLKYIEEQSKILREAFTKVERKQLQKTNNFLDTLNSTVLTDLREIRQQYDEIWQSTVISLESQREESRREILAISTRLSILADEVVFQKRMSIVQSVLLLLCLGLVIFSRVSTTGPIDFPSRSRILGSFPIESPIESSPESPQHVTDSLPNSRLWIGPGHRRQRSDDSAMSGEGSRDESPPTPVSSYSRSEKSLTPPSGVNASTTYIGAEHLELPQQQSTKPSIPIRSSSYNELKELPNLARTSSPVRTPKRRKGFIHQQASPPADDILTSTTTNESPAPDSSPHSISNTLQQYQTPILSTTPASPSPSPAQSPVQEGRHRQSFGITRKPLPALPKDSGGG